MLSQSGLIDLAWLSHVSFDGTVHYYGGCDLRNNHSTVMEICLGRRAGCPHVLHAAEQQSSHVRCQSAARCVQLCRLLTPIDGPPSHRHAGRGLSSRLEMKSIRPTISSAPNKCRFPCGWLQVYAGLQMAHSRTSSSGRPTILLPWESIPSTSIEC